ncbi:hypothetical protein AWB77_05025 [Caballeronia fortuita]|uniref:Periplasmic protein n=1 Tax=Caballeronia fortuita TaxID=1777138 RepID=A0A158DAE5_9BURK|nr:DUF2092 domain-containing protein [Caballeronia fortuita]SAK90777.1 hypothetical protein AWB77_05025 [Caballeronia fortuita]
MTKTFAKLSLCGLVAGALCSAGSYAVAKETETAHAAAQVPDAEALNALTRMSAYMQTVKQFVLDVDSTTDQILVNGKTEQLVQMAHTTKLTVNRPDHLKADITGIAPDSSRHAYFDGKHFTLYTQPDNYYATVDAPATIKELMSDLGTKYGIELPLSDIFTLGANPSDMKRIISAAYLGDEVVSGATCSHYAYHENTVDWQLWIKKGDQPLPCKLNIVTRLDSERPQFTAVYHWNLNPEIDNGTFAFTAPKNAHEITFVQNKGAQ